MGWTEPVSTIASVGGTLFGFLQWRDAKKAQGENKKLTAQLQQIGTNTNSLPLMLDMLRELKRFGGKFPEDQSVKGKITFFDQELAKFEENLKYNQDAAGWLAQKNTRQHLAKDSGDEALKICFLNLPDSERHNFYKDIYKYLTLLFFALDKGVYIPAELISPSIPYKKAYQEAFKSIIQKIPRELSVDADDRLKKRINNLMSELG
jgi:hypothetical protein